MEATGKVLLVLGGVFLILGLVFILLGKVPLLGRLPGDIHIKWGTGSCYFPLVTSVLLSIVATIVLNLIMRLLRK